jgi:dTMP kinase
MKKRGTFIVIEGTDGSGKATQTKLLATALKKNGRKVQTIAFPQYGMPSAAPIEAYLRGEYGSLHELGPYRASILYAIDRVAARKKIMSWLAAGNVVIADRYMASNLAHQGAKIADLQSRRKFWDWDREFEFGLMGIPQPDCTLVLLVPPNVSQKLILMKQQRAYLNTKKRDIHEKDVRYQRLVANVYTDLARYDNNFKIINCAPEGHLLPIDNIHKLVMSSVQRCLK